MQSLLEMVTGSEHDLHFAICTEGYTIAENRTVIAVKALENKSDYLLFIDDDMVFPKNTLDRLIARDKDIIGIPYYSRVLPRKSVVVLEDGTELKGEIPDDLFKCQHVGTGVMLIKTDVFKNIIRPWFEFKTSLEGFTLQGEDAFFCEVARKRGYDIWCDSTLSLRHIGDRTF
jgi:GT2 family glycosyltransferase